MLGTTLLFAAVRPSVPLVAGHRAPTTPVRWLRRVPAAAMRSAGGSSPRPPSAKQSLGQNFLQDVAMAQRIAGSLVGAADDGGRRVVELGPGQGAITRWLLPTYPSMTAVELDGRMVSLLREELPALSLREADMLKLDWAELAAESGGQLSLVSNTPFYLTSPLLFKLLGSLEHVQQAVLTTQVTESPMISHSLP